MNKLQAIFQSISDEELKAIVRDLQEQQTTGILPDGAARSLARRITSEVQVTTSNC